MFENGKASVSTTGPKQLGALGEGISLYFYILKYLTYYFAFATILALPHMMVAYSGNAISEDVLGQTTPLIKLTAINHADPALIEADDGTRRRQQPGDGESEEDPWWTLLRCEYNPSVENLRYLGSDMKRDAAAGMITRNDLIYSFVFVLMWKYIKRKVDIVVRQTDEDNVTAGDYTVCATGFPTNASEEDIRSFFSDLYTLDRKDWEFKGYLCGFWGAKKARHPKECIGYDLKPIPISDLRPVEDLAGLHDKENYIGSWVADVNIAHPNGALIRRCQALKKYTNKLLEARARVKKYSPGTPLKGGSNANRLKVAEAKLAQVELKIAKLTGALKSSASSFEQIDNECMAAFITFENEDSYIRCIKDFKRYRPRSLFNPWTWLVPPTPQVLKFNGTHNLNVETCSEPSNIIWENLEDSELSRYMRKFVTSLVTISMLVVSLALVILVKRAKKDVESNVPDLSKCTKGLPAVFNVSPDTITLTWYPEFDGYCGQDENFIVVDGFFQSLDASYFNPSSLIEQYNGTCQDPCVESSNEKITCVGYADNKDVDDTIFTRIRSVSSWVFDEEVGNPYYFDHPGKDLCKQSSLWTTCGSETRSYMEDEIIDYWEDREVLREGIKEKVSRDDIAFVLDDAIQCDKGGHDPSFTQGTTNPPQKNCTSVQKQTMKGCFCLTELMSKIQEFGIFDGVQAILDDYSEVCGSFASQYALAQVLVGGSAAMISVINIFLKSAVKGTANFEHHKSLSAETKAISSTTFLSLFVNTALLVMIVHAKIDSPLNNIGMLNGSADDFNYFWYVNAGSSIILTMAINAGKSVLF